MARHKGMQAPPIAQAVRIERDGMVFEGTYIVDGAMIRVESVILESRTARIAGASPLVLAKIILTELLFLDHERHAR